MKKGTCRKSPRAIHEHLAKTLKDFGDIPVDKKSPWLKKGAQKVNLCEYMWNDTVDTRNRALSTPFVQEMKIGTLDPTAFGGYMVQDSVYCQKAQKDLDLASQKAEGDLKQFLTEKAKSYKSYYEALFKEWHIYDASGIGLGEACQKYVDSLNHTAQKEEPIYLLVASIPCARLWPWIGQQITQGEPKSGCYTEWIAENFDPKSDGYLKYEARVNAAYQLGKLDWCKAVDIYKKCMNGEADFFASAEDK